MLKLQPTFQLNRPGPLAPVVDIKSQLNSLWVDTKKIDAQVESDMGTASKNKRSFDDFQKAFNKARDKFPTRSDEENYLWILQAYKSNGYTVEWVDIDTELKNVWQVNPEEVIESESIELDTPIQETVDEKSLVGRIASSSPWVAKWLLKWWLKWSKDIFSGFVSSAPSIVGNTFGFAADVLTPKEWEWLWDYFREKWASEKQGILDMLWADEEDYTTKAGGLGWEVASLFIPWGQTKLISKYPQAAEKIKKLWVVADDIVTRFPKIAEKIQKVVSSKLTQSAIKWATETGKFEVVSEGELSPTTLAIWAVTNPVLDKTGKVIKWVISSDNISKMKKIIRPWTKQKASLLDDDMSSILWSLKVNEKKPESIIGLYDDLTQIQQSLYKDKINPLLKKWADSNEKININTIIDDILPGLWENKKIKWKSLAKVFGRGDDIKQFEKVIKNIRGMWNLDFLEAEIMKQHASALLLANKSSRAPILSSMQQDFLLKFNKWLQDNIESKLESITWEWVKAYKSEYGAIARHLDELNRRIISESKMSGDALFSWLGKISGIRDIADGRVTQGLTTILTWEILKLMKDPDELLKKVIRDLYKWPWFKSAIWDATMLWAKVKWTTETSEMLDEWDILR